MRRWLIAAACAALLGLVPLSAAMTSESAVTCKAGKPCSIAPPP